MSHRNIVRLLSVCCGLQTLVGSALADESHTNTAPTFAASVHKGEIVGSEQIQRIFLTSGPHSILLVSPQGLIVDATTPGKVTFQPSDERFTIIAQMTGSAVEQITSSDCIARLKEAYPGAKILEESSVRIDAQGVPLFEVLWKPPGVSERMVRVAFYPSPAGLIQFSVISDAQNAGEAQEAYRGLLRGLRTNKKGKIEIVPFTNAS